MSLRKIRDDVAVRKHGPFWNARCPARILQESEVVFPRFGRFPRQPAALEEGAAERHRAGEAPRRYHTHHIFYEDIHSDSTQWRQQIAGLSRDYMFNACIRNDLIERVGAIFPNNYDF